MDEVSEKELFETVPAHKAVAALAIPSIISQVVSIIYNLADTFFIGQFGNPYMVAGVTLVSVSYTHLDVYKRQALFPYAIGDGKAFPVGNSDGTASIKNFTYNL